jgi:sortase A
MRKFSYLLILTGILIFFYPFYNYYTSVSAEKELLNKWGNLEGDNKERFNVLEITDSFIRLEDIFLSAQETEETEPERQPRELDDKYLLGIIEIEKLSLKLPILAGASDSNLKKGAGHLNGTSKFGEIGNAAIAAHRSRTYGRQFNRLDELEIGDEINIITKGLTYTYTVFETKIVKPTDVYVLNKMGDKGVLTLITCDPVVGATHRLIVHGELK